MQISWRMKVWDSKGLLKETIENDDAIDELTSFSVDNIGNCLEAEFIGVPADLNLRARDIIQLEVLTELDYIPLWRGFLIQVGPARSRDFHTYRAVGLARRFYEIPHPRYKLGALDANDVAELAYFSQFDYSGGPASEKVVVPAGVWRTLGDSDRNPLTHFQVGPRYPALESWGEVLDGLANLAGEFFVPPGQTYQYDGVVYGEEETVPGVKWGVDAVGDMHFRRPKATDETTREVDEDESGILVVWHDINAEDTVDYVIFIYAAEPAEGWRWWASDPSIITDFEEEILPAWEIFGDGVVHDPQSVNSGEPAGDYVSGRRIALENPLDFMKREPVTEFVVGSWSNSDNAFDGDSATAATATGPAGFDVLNEEYGHRGGIFHVRMRTSAPRNLEFSAAWRDSDGTLYLIGSYYIETVADQTMDLYLPIVTRRVPSEETRLAIISTEGFDLDDEVFRFELYVPDREVGARMAQAYTQGVESEPAEVHLLEELGGVLTDIDLTPRGESSQRIKVERIEWRFSREGGADTIYHIGRPQDSEKISHRIVMETLARRQGRDAARTLVRAARSVRKS